MGDICFSFQKLDAFKSARELVKTIYLLTEKFPHSEQFGLTSQLRRAAVSVVSNIAEGSGRKGLGEKIHFLEIAYGSLTETYSQLLIAQDLGYVSEEDIQSLNPKYSACSGLLGGLRASFERKKANEQKNKV